MMLMAATLLVAATAAAFIPASGAMEYMLRDHRKDVKAFERSSKAIGHRELQHWAEGTLPLLKEHLAHAQQIAGAIGMDGGIEAAGPQ